MRWMDITGFIAEMVFVLRFKNDKSKQLRDKILQDKHYLYQQILIITFLLFNENNKKGLFSLCFLLSLGHRKSQSFIH